MESAEAENSQSESESEGSGEEENQPPQKSLFGDSMPKSAGLFGNLTEEKKETKLFSFSGTNMFSSSPLFSNTGSSSLFNSGATGSLFGSKPLFNFSNVDNKNTGFFDKKKEEEEKSEDDGEGGEDNDLFKSNSPNPYNPQETTKVNEQGPYKKKFLQELENIFIYLKKDGKFVSKGKGFLSLEFAQIDGKKIGVVVFR